MTKKSKPHSIDSAIHLATPWLVVFTGAIYFFYDFIQLNMFNALNVLLIHEFNVTASQLGQLSAFYFYAIIPLLLPAGIMLDRVSTRKVMVIAMTIMSLSTLLFSMTHQFWVMAACRFMTGIAGTTCLLSCVRLASRWFPPRRMALVIGLIVTMAMMGGVVAQTPFTWLTEMIGWRLTVFWDGMLGLFFTVIIASIVRDYPSGYKLVHEKCRGYLSEIGFWPSLKLVWKNTQNWLGGFFTAFLNLPVFLLGGLWGSLYLTQAHQFNRIDASYVTSMIFFGLIIGSPLSGWISDRIGLRRLPMMICAGFSFIIILLIMFISQLSLTTAMLLFLLLGVFSSAQIISYPLIAESNSPALTGTAEGLASILIMAGGITQPFFGWLMDLRWQNVFVNNVPFYSISDYRLAMSIMPVAFVLALIASYFIKETYVRGKHKILSPET